ncbi:MAG: pilin major subunit VirB2 [Proteobacteria bacterium]|nr:pilin major subunit VirB2 [Pseudomonadota bacterium]
MIESKFVRTNATSSWSHRPVLRRFVAVIATFGVPALAYAQTVTGGASPQTMINNVCTFILGPFGETIAVLGIIGIGFLFMFGRASLGIIAGIIGGIVIMFGASYLGSTLTGGG